MKNSWLAKIMFRKEGTGFRLIGLGSNHLNSFHVSETLGMFVFLFLVKLRGWKEVQGGLKIHSIYIYIYILSF
jgi:hypothetical protein